MGSTFLAITHLYAIINNVVLVPIAKRKKKYLDFLTPILQSQVAENQALTGYHLGPIYSVSTRK